MHLSPDILLLLALFLFLAGFLSALYYGRKQLAAAKEKLRTNIAKDLHDDVSSTLNSIHFFAEALEKRTLTQSERNRFLELISRSSNEVKEKISDIIWVIHPQDDNWESLLLKCKRYASDLLDCRNIGCTFTIEGTPPAKVGLSVKKNTWLIFKELVTNAARHANANCVEIRFTIESRQILLSVSDDGEGFDPDTLADTGYGLMNIKSRIEALKGKINLNATPENGTHWQMQIPV